MTDVAVRATATKAVPQDYTIPGAQELLPKSVSASMDGTGAASAWFPCLQILDPGGHVMVTAVADSSIAAGASADVSWFPKLKRTAVVAPSPNPLGTLWAWWDFSDTTTITLDGSSKIVNITDKTGNGHDASQGTAGQRPSESTLNGLNCGLFASASKTALVSSGWTPSLANPFTVALVWTQTIASSANYQPGPIGGGPSPPPAILFDNFDNTRLVMQLGGGSILVPFAAPYTQQQATLIYNGASSSLRLNGVANAGGTDTDVATNMSLGASHFPTDPTIMQHQDGKIGEALVYEGALTASQYAAVEAYLKAKWATP